MVEGSGVSNVATLALSTAISTNARYRNASASSTNRLRRRELWDRLAEASIHRRPHCRSQPNVRHTGPFTLTTPASRFPGASLSVRVAVGWESGELCCSPGNVRGAAPLALSEPRRMLGLTAHISCSACADHYLAAGSSHAEAHPTQLYRATAYNERCSQRKPSPVTRIRVSQELIIVKQGIRARRRHKSVDLAALHTSTA